MKIKNLPKHIYLQIGEDCDHTDWNDIYPSHEVTWCSDKINNNDIVYHLDLRRLDNNSKYVSKKEFDAMAEVVKHLLKRISKLEKAKG